MSRLQRRRGRAEDIAATRRVTKRPDPDEIKELQEQEEETKEQPVKEETPITDESTENTVETAPKEQDEPSSNIVPEDKQENVSEPKPSTPETVQTSSEDLKKEETNDKKIQPDREQVKIHAFDNERLTAFMEVTGIRFKNQAVAALLDIAEGVQEPLEGYAKEDYEMSVEIKRRKFDRNGWATE